MSKMSKIRLLLEFEGNPAMVMNGVGPGVQTEIYLEGLGWFANARIVGMSVQGMTSISSTYGRHGYPGDWTDDEEPAVIPVLAITRVTDPARTANGSYNCWQHQLPGEGHLIDRYAKEHPR